MNNLIPELIVVIANFLTPITLFKLCTNKYLTLLLLDIIKTKQLEGAIFAKPWYPLNEKEKIFEGECEISNSFTFPVEFCGTQIGTVIRKGFLNNQFWCGYYHFNHTIYFTHEKNDECDAQSIADIVGFDEEITYSRFDNNYYVIGWDHGHSHNANIAGYQTLESTMDQIVCFHRKVQINKNKIIDYFQKGFIC